MTAQTFLDGRVELRPGDCLDVLRAMPDASVDSIVTDPPYALVSIVKQYGSANAAPAKGDLYKRASAGFMGKQWDTGERAFSVEFWAEALRVLKPGGHVLAFSGTRTYHRLACAIEDAGFEIRDQVGWAFGSGFPKSHDVSKGIDKKRVEDIEPVRVVCRAIRAAMDVAGIKSRHLVEHFDGCHPRLIDHWAARDTDSQPSLPTWEQWERLKDVLPLASDLDAEVWRLNGRKGKPGDAWQNAEIVGLYGGQTPGFGEHRFSVRDTAIRQATSAAREWQGWGTALKPAWEPVCVARKPLIGTVAENVLAHGTGAINVDGCRVEPTGQSRARVGEASQARRYTENGSTNFAAMPGVRGGNPDGRWPANLIHDGSDEVTALFPQTTSGTKNAGTWEKSGRSAGIMGEIVPRISERDFQGDTGSAARFFYTPKADADDRLGSKHPTVKPVDLMQYLVRLVTPKGGVVLDPFAGTGTTGEAAFREGMRAILIEREAEYQADIAKRMALVFAGPDERKRARTKPESHETLPLFGGGE